jgi:hypothetical protein
VSANTRMRSGCWFPNGGATFEWIPSTQKLKIYRGDNANASDAPLIEVRQRGRPVGGAGLREGIGIGA